MNTPTYKEQFDKLTSAYIHNQVRPYDSCACFLGNLMNGRRDWVWGRDAMSFKTFKSQSAQQSYYMIPMTMKEVFAFIKGQNGGLYKPQELYNIEKIFMTKIKEVDFDDRAEENEHYEAVLFEAFSLALDALKALHISKGEVVEEEFVFIQRQKQNHESHISTAV